jgi:hypothetical protein
LLGLVRSIAMGWVCIDDACSVKYYAISDIIKGMVDSIIQFLINIAPVYYLILILTITGIFIIYMFWYIKKVILVEEM